MAAMQASLRRDTAESLRRFAVVEAETARILRSAAEVTTDFKTAQRRRQVANRADEQQALALARAHRLDPR